MISDLLANPPSWLSQRLVIYWVIASVVISLLIRITKQIDKPWAKRINAICIDIWSLFFQPKNQKESNDNAN